MSKNVVDIQRYGKRSVAIERFSITLTCMKFHQLYEYQKRHKLFVNLYKQAEKASGSNI
jgi:hypothetical protein